MIPETVAFYAGLAITFVGLLVWVVRPASAPGKSEIEFLGFRFSLDVPALAVMVIGIALMMLTPGLRIAPEPPPPPLPPVKKIVCTGQYEGSCPGAHDMFYTCGTFGTDDQIADQICKGVKKGVLRLKTVGGHKCGYALIEVVCRAGG